jgi:hypothetical protein
MILDIYSRKIVGWEIHECESAENASLLIKKAVLKEQCSSQPLVHLFSASFLYIGTLKEIDIESV